MKKVILLLTAISIAFTSCSSDDDNDTPQAVDFTISDLSLSKGTVGSEVTITGTGFPNSSDDVTVSFNDVQAVITSINTTTIVSSVPANATTGEVTVKYDTKTINAGMFTILDPLVENKVENLPAPQTGGQGTGQAIGGVFTKFDFETGAVTTSETDWDIAFRGTTIAVNGGEVTGTADEPARNGNAGAAIVTGTFASATSAEGLTFNQDASTTFAIPTGSDNGWYNYNFMTNIISPIPGKVLVFRTRNGNYAKIEILSYYLNEDTSQSGRNYTFNYVYNPNDGETVLE
ncbi:IPT/TIG domain-containing protein [Aquimarina algiphila]|uniref:IPT/TIG domain-containing protein n=1 Tax=Aquimarina algiphila TaxID=2047982 RepID=UPI002491EA79|nr:HmuY family protein [Aquimarina algiphila]